MKIWKQKIMSAALDFHGIGETETASKEQFEKVYRMYRKMWWAKRRSEDNTFFTERIEQAIESELLDY